MSQISRAGYDPLWIKSILGGFEIYNSAKWSIYYPFFLLGSIDYKTGYETMKVMNMVSLAHVFIYFINMYFLCRTITKNKLASFVGASLSIINPTPGCLAGWIEIIAAYAWMPMFLNGLIQLIDNHKSKIGVLLTAVAILGFTANPAQPIIHAFYSGLPLIIFGVWCNKDKIKKISIKFIYTGIFSFCISSVGIIPMYLSYPKMLRWVGGTVVGMEKIPFSKFQAGKVSPISELLISDSVASGLGHIYIGPIAIVLLIVLILFIFTGAKSKLSKNNWVIFSFTLIALYFFLSSLGLNFMTYINWHIPLINKIREPIRHAIMFGLSAAVLGSYSFNCILELKNQKNILVGSISFVCIAALYFTHIISLEISIISALLILGSLRFAPTHKIKLGIITFILIVINCFNAPKKEVLKNPEKLLVNSEKVKSAMSVLEYIKTLDPNSDYKFVTLDKTLPYHRWSMLGAYFQLRSFATSFDPMPEKQINDLMFSELQFNYMSLWGAKYYISDKSQEKLLPKYFERIKNFDRVSVFQNNLAKENFYLADKIIYSDANNAKLLERLYRKNQTMLANNVVLTDDKSSVFQIKKNDKSKILASKVDHNKISLELDIKSPRLIVLNEYLNESWCAKCNGEKITIRNINYNQIGVKVSPTCKNLVFQYRPLLSYYLRMLQLMSFFFIFCLFILKLIKGKFRFKTHEK